MSLTFSPAPLALPFLCGKAKSVKGDSKVEQ